MERFLWVCFGGALGTGARYLLSMWAIRAWGIAFPLWTIGINALGSFLLALILQIAAARGAQSSTVVFALTTGVMGGFTTYSTFNYETIRLFQEGAFQRAALNLAVTLFGCLAAGALGILAARWLLAR